MARAQAKTLVRWGERGRWGTGLRLGGLFLALAVAGAASASPLSIYGFNPRAMAMWDAQTAAADDATATFYNPALLSQVESTVVSFGYQLVLPALDVSAVSGAWREGFEPVLPQPFQSATIGVVFPLGGKIERRLTLGIGISLPVGYLVRVRSVDAARPSFFLHESSVRKMVLVPALSWRVSDTFSVGAGLQLLANYGGPVSVSSDVFASQITNREMTIELSTRTALVAGVAWSPLEGLNLGVSYREEIGLDYALPATILLEDLATLQLTLFGTTLWTPHELSAGAAYHVGATTFTADLVYGMWSRAPSPQLTVNLDSDGPLLDAFGLGTALDICSDVATFEADGTVTCRPQPPGFVDVLSPKLGVEHRLSEAFVVRAGYGYRPTPIPDQRGDTNYLDNSTHTLGLGLGYTFRDPLEVFEQPVTFDLAAQVGLLSARLADKTRATSADYRYGGLLYQVGGVFRYQF